MITALLEWLALIRTFGWTFGMNASGSAVAVAWTQVLVAGVSAMALFRTSLFTVRAGDRDIGVGPSSFLQIFLAAADREVDRMRARSRAGTVSEIMKGVSYRKAFQALPTYCLALMQNVSDDDQRELRRALETLDSQQVDETLKARILGLELMNVVGKDVLTAAVGSLGDEIKEPAAAPKPVRVNSGGGA